MRPQHRSGATMPEIVNDNENFLVELSKKCLIPEYDIHTHTYIAYREGDLAHIHIGDPFQDYSILVLLLCSLDVVICTDIEDEVIGNINDPDFFEHFDERLEHHYAVMTQEREHYRENDNDDEDLHLYPEK